ncbi:MAG TPA: serine/threonine-protein kinase [Kofleriaceae bacterium]|nr:serine/threonine-protein kinase [Kofleriaceae bacterium]
MPETSDHVPPPPSDQELACGSTIGEFTIDSRLSAGGFGAVYRAHDRRTGEEVAVKVLHAHLAANSATVARFEREFRAAASLTHPGIVKVLADGRLPDGRPWFAMELLHGHELEEQLRGGGRCTPAACLQIIREVADALAVAHAQAIIHRDIKASNVFLTGDRIVLLDFGVAKLLDLDGEPLTQTGTTVGTPASMAPEQARGTRVDARTDVYGLGALLFHMLTGSKPFSGHETHEMRFLHQHARRPRPSSRATVPDVFDTIVSKAMAIDPEARYPTPRALVEAFEQALRATGVGPEEPAREGAPMFLLAELATIDDSLAAPSEELWDDLEEVRAAFHELTGPPYVVHIVTDTSILVERRGEPGSVEHVVEDCRRLEARLRTRRTAHPSVRVRLVVDERPPASEVRPDPTEPVVIVVPAPRR